MLLFHSRKSYNAVLTAHEEVNGSFYFRYHSDEEGRSYPERKTDRVGKGSDKIQMKKKSNAPCIS